MAEVAASGPAASGAAIVLCGFMAAGKSAAAREIGRALDVEPADSDALLEVELGEPIAGFFSREGEEAFREREEAVILRMLDDDGGGAPRVIALGGGALAGAAVCEALRGHMVVWCKVDLETAWERAQRNTNRPLASDRDQFEQRYAERQPLYEALARAILPANAREAAAKATPWLVAMLGFPQVRMIWAEAGSSAYPAVIGPGATAVFDAARSFAPGSFPHRSFCIADTQALSHHRDLLPAHELVIEVGGGEASKALSEVERVLTELAGAGARRDDAIVALGGGVVGDLAGFCAATYQRGVPVVQIPTTLVAQVDSAYGGKTGVDLPAAKNYIGAYHQPLAVLADPATLETLSQEELAAGFVEVVKTGLLRGGELWQKVRAITDLRTGITPDVIFTCALTKIEIVSADERDAGVRATLNFGHTVGHAIETCTGYERYRHGEAVGLGLLAALRLSGAGGLREEVGDLLGRHDLPTTLDPGFDEQAMLTALARDKKASRDGIGFVLLDEPGRAAWGQPVEPDSLRDAVRELIPS